MRLFKIVLNIFLFFSFENTFHRDELQIGGVFIRIYNEMPTFPIQQPKEFINHLLDYLQQAFHFMKTKKYPIIFCNDARKGGGDGILVPTLAVNHPHYKKAIESKGSGTFAEALNHYNRSKQLKKLEDEAILEQKQMLAKCKYKFPNEEMVEKCTVMVLKALIAVIKANAEVELQCMDSFELIFNLVSNNLFSQVRDDIRRRNQKTGLFK